MGPSATSASDVLILLGLAVAFAAPYGAYAGYTRLVNRRGSARWRWVAASVAVHTLGWVATLFGFMGLLDISFWQPWYVATVTTTVLIGFALAFSLLTFRQLDQH